MTTRLEYLKKCIVSGKPIEYKNWYTHCFAIPLLKDTANWKDSTTPLSVVTQGDGLYYTDLNENNEYVLVKIVDYKRDTPLFSFQEEIEVDSSWLPTISSKITTKIGILIVNALVLYPALGTKVDFINSKIKVSEIESILANKVRNDDVATDKDIRVAEMINCIDRLCFLSSLATLVNLAATPKAITPPPNIDKIRKELLKEYQGQLHDPVKVVELETKLAEVDKEYLADDPAAKNIFNSKSKTARKKMFLMLGDTMDFIDDGENKVVVSPLTEGLSTSPEDFPKYMNDLRLGSFARGSSTALSGYSYKILQRSLTGLTILDKPCDTTRGYKRIIDSKSYKKLVSRYIKSGTKWILIDSLESAKQYVGKEVEIRSTMYCTSPGNTVCYACMSEAYKTFPNGITNIAANISSTLMNQFLKLIHGKITETVNIDMEDLVT